MEDENPLIFDRVSESRYAHHMANAAKRIWAWIVSMFAVVLVIGSLWTIHTHWGFWRPNDAATAWVVVDAIADSVAALGAVAVAVFALRGLHSLRLAREQLGIARQ